MVTTPALTSNKEMVQDKELSNVIQGTAENLLSKLEESVAATSISGRGIPLSKTETSSAKGVKYIYN